MLAVLFPVGVIAVTKEDAKEMVTQAEAEADVQRAQTQADMFSLAMAAASQAAADQIAIAQASVQRAKRNVVFCVINSPVNGVIIDRRVEIGQTVVSSLSAPSLFLIAKDLSKMQVLVQVNEANIGNIRIMFGRPVPARSPRPPRSRGPRASSARHDSRGSTGISSSSWAHNSVPAQRLHRATRVMRNLFMRVLRSAQVVIGDTGLNPANAGRCWCCPK